MKLVDKRGKVFGIINVIDLTIIVVIVVAALAAGAYFSVSDNGNGAGQKITYEIEMQRQTKTFADSVEIGDTVSDSEKNIVIGTIINKNVTPATQVNPDLEQGKYVKSTVPDAYNVVITVEADAIVSDKNILVNGLEIKTGIEFYAKGKGFVSNSFILGIKLD